MEHKSLVTQPESSPFCPLTMQSLKSKSQFIYHCDCHAFLTEGKFRADVGHLPLLQTCFRSKVISFSLPPSFSLHPSLSIYLSLLHASYSPCLVLWKDLGLKHKCGKLVFWEVNGWARNSVWWRHQNCDKKAPLTPHLNESEVIPTPCILAMCCWLSKTSHGSMFCKQLQVMDEPPRLLIVADHPSDSVNATKRLLCFE